MIDRDNGASLANTFGVDLDGRRRERCVDVVDRNRIVRIGGATIVIVILVKDGNSKERVISALARDVHHNAQAPFLTGFGNEVRRNELGYWHREVDAVDKDIDY